MIQLGEKKGTKDEPHFVIQMSASVGDTTFENAFKFDVYAETADEAWELINGYLDDLCLRHGFKRTDNRLFCAQECSNCNLSLDECRRIGGIR